MSAGAKALEAQGREIAKEASARQAKAADPGSSVWVSASAGSGKTTVLANRVLALLLARTDPSKILCLTFTKAAAANMQNRILQRLAVWANLPDSDLAAIIAPHLTQRPDAADIRRARGLFARVLEAPDGLRIQTLHGFCQTLLGRFPLEAGISPGAEVLEARNAGQLVRRAYQDIIGPDADAALLDAMATLASGFIQSDIEARLVDLVDKRHRLQTLRDHHGGTEGLIAALAAKLCVDLSKSDEDLVAAAVAEGSFDRDGLAHLASIAAQIDSTTERRLASLIGPWLEADDARRQSDVNNYLSAFLTDKHSIRKNCPTKKVLGDHPGLKTVFESEAKRLFDLTEQRKILRQVQATAALLRLGSAVIDRYEELKRRQGRLDYADLIALAGRLLHDKTATQWVLYKLDSGLEHILVDEAQDTSPAQWAVIRRLAEAFFEGEGAAEARRENSPEALDRSLFVVGDPKQSIYSFQDADPQTFIDQRADLARRVTEAGRAWTEVPLEVSFRSAESVLGFVDAVFDDLDASPGVALDGRQVRHRARLLGMAGCVELWPLAPKPEKAESEPWLAPVTRADEEDGRSRLALAIAETIRCWTQDPTTPGEAGWLESQGRQVRPGDILILVRTRSDFAERLIRALKERRVPVAGIDRFIVDSQLPVQDLMALGQTLLLPEDDLTLATVLKGPFFGFDEARLFRLCWRRPGSLIARLRESDDPVEADAAARLAELASLARSLRPFEFYSRLLDEGGRAAILQRLGLEAEEALDEFLTLALDFEVLSAPSLEGFLGWMAADRRELKRDAETGDRLVRVMTIHGAKGLEAPIVFLPDTTQVTPDRYEPLWLDRAEDERDDPLLLWPLRSGDATEDSDRLMERLRRRSAEERDRLLYVALTRAIERLYICGWAGGNSKDGHHKKSWYPLLQDRLAAQPNATERDFETDLPLDQGGWSGTALQLSQPQRVETRRETERAEGRPPSALPGWAHQRAPDEPDPPRPLAPSRARQEAAPPVLSPRQRAEGRGLQRGLLVHKLLEVLPDVAPDARATTAEALLARRPGLTPAAAEAVTASVLAILESPDFAGFFGPGSRAEVDVTGLLETPDGPQAVSGRIDRLAVTDAGVWVLDYKSDRLPPSAASNTPRAYLTQMALYCRLLGKIYREKPVSAALLWTEGPVFMPLPPELLNLDRIPPGP